MTTLKDAALGYSGKKDITELDKVPTDLQVYESSFKNAQGQDIKFFYIELNGSKYNIKGAAMIKLKEMLSLRPQTKYVKINKSADGQYSVIPLD